MSLRIPQPLRAPVFRDLAAGRVVVTLGNAIGPIALAFAVLDLTGSVTALGFVVAARSLAIIAFLLIGGTIADRLPRQHIMVFSCITAAVTQAIVATVVLTGVASVGLLVALSFVNGVFAALWLPASASVLVQIVPTEQLQQSNALIRLGTNLAMMAGTALGGFFVAAVGPGWGLTIDASTSAIAAAIFARIRGSSVLAGDGPGTRFMAALLQGWHEFAARRWLWTVVLGFLVMHAVSSGAIQVLGPALAGATFGRGNWGLILGCQVLGMTVGAFFALRVRSTHLLRYGLLCMFGTAVPLAALAASPVPAFLFAAFFVGGVALEQFTVAWDTTMQTHVPTASLALVTAYDAMGSYIAMPLGEVAAGPIGQSVGTSTAIAGAAVIVVAAVIVMLSTRDVRDLSQPVGSNPRRGAPVSEEGQAHGRP
jgi:MFS family permease